MTDAPKPANVQETTAASSGQAAPDPRAMRGSENLALSDRIAYSVVAWRDRGGPIAEQYRAVRTSLMAHYEEKSKEKDQKPRFCLLVTSAERGEGKTVTCANLGVVLTEQSCRTVIVDCDLRTAGLAKVLGLHKSPGLADVICHRAKANGSTEPAVMSSSRQPVELDQIIQETGIPNLFAIPAGAAKTDEISTLLGRPELHEIIRDLKARFDVVLLDTPAVNAVSDVGMLRQLEGEALLSLQMNHTRRESVERAIRLLKSVQIDIAGVVLTHQKFFIPKFLYRWV